MYEVGFVLVVRDQFQAMLSVPLEALPYFISNVDVPFVLASPVMMLGAAYLRLGSFALTLALPELRIAIEPPPAKTPFSMSSITQGPLPAPRVQSVAVPKYKAVMVPGPSSPMWFSML